MIRHALAAALFSLTSIASAQEWTPLFDGRTLEGWTSRSDPRSWTVEDGELVASGKGDWLRTTRHYRDFELKLDFLVGPSGNSGIGLRGSSQGDPAFTGFEIQVLDSHGQEPSNTNCGAVYGAVPPAAMAVRPAGEWNSLHISLAGDTLNAWLNDVQIHDDTRLDRRGYRHIRNRPWPLNNRLPTGYIALQDHGDVVRYRNIRILDKSGFADPGGFEPLIRSDGDLSGWHARGGGTWTVRDGILMGRDGPGHLYSNETFGDMEMRAFVMLNTKGNSGFYCRTVPRPDNPDTWPIGYEAQLDNHDPKNFTGCIYDRAWADRMITEDEKWLDYRVRIIGHHMQTWINGVPMSDATFDPAQTGVPDIGHIVLQTHHKGNVVRWRDIEVRKLEDEG